MEVLYKTLSLSWTPSLDSGHCFFKKKEQLPPKNLSFLLRELPLERYQSHTLKLFHAFKLCLYNPTRKNYKSSTLTFWKRVTHILVLWFIHQSYSCVWWKDSFWGYINIEVWIRLLSRTVFLFERLISYSNSRWS